MHFCMIVGPMASGKSNVLIGYAHSLVYARRNYIAIYPATDTRTPDGYISSRTGSKIEAKKIYTANDLVSLQRKLDGISSLIIDEVQFFNAELINLVKKCIYLGVNVYASGLLGDVNGEVFVNTARLMALADEIVLLDGVCKICGRPSTMSIRYIDGKPDKTRDIIIEGTRSGVEYKDLCNECWCKEMSNG